MPKDTSIKKILVVGAGPIVIGQGCEFDYSGTQACKALREEGYEVVLVNSNPATIMTDPQFAERTYIEPITPESVRRIIELEQANGTPIDALLPTLGGQTALNCACDLHDQGILKEFDIEMIGADRDVIQRAEDREVFHHECSGGSCRHTVADARGDARAKPVRTATLDGMLARRGVSGVDLLCADCESFPRLSALINPDSQTHRL